MNLCVNIDHVATLREARGGIEPDPVQAAVICELAGAHGITFHLREDRRHIKERDAFLLREIIHVKLNMEMANTAEMVKLASGFKPDQVTLVPEKRRELTTEGGLDAAKYKNSIRDTVTKLHDKGITVSLFINPVKEQIKASAGTGAECVELHTGEYANAKDKKSANIQMERIRDSAEYANKMGLKVYAGHGLNYRNVKGLLDMPFLEELNIGHSIVSRAVYTGMDTAVKEMLAVMGV